MELYERIQTKIIEMGGCEVGFFKDNFKGFINGISFYVKLSKAVLKEISDKPTYSYFHHYRTVNSLIDQIELQIGTMLDKEGYGYFPVPASQTVGGHSSFRGVYSHKKAACLSGLGYIGKSGLFISSLCGSMVRLGTVFTDYKLPVSDKMIKEDCKDCDICIKSCPALALNRDNGIDRKCCSDYMKKEFQEIGRGAVCGICIRVCPKNKLN